MTRAVAVVLAVLLGVVPVSSLPSSASASASASSVATVAPPAVSARWSPNLNWRDQRHAVTHADARWVRDLRRDLARAKRVPPGAYSCPADFGDRVVLAFDRSTHVAQVHIELTGCRFVSQAGGPARQLDKNLRHDLREIAPQRWQPDLR